jgi:hypothetical protein
MKNEATKVRQIYGPAGVYISFTSFKPPLTGGDYYRSTFAEETQIPADMKKFTIITLLLIATAFTTMSFITAPQSPRGPAIQFDNVVHDFGTLPWSQPRSNAGICEFRFTNTGDEPLIITGVRASCGCTAPRYTADPVLPGESGVITVQYDNSRQGNFAKTVTVTTNANPQSVTLTIRGNVVRDQPATPVNPGASSGPVNR